MKKIKVGILIAYDYEFVKISLPLIYEHVEEIHFAVDADGLTWAGESFEIKPEFWDWVTQFDKDNKIRIYKDHFYVEELTPMQCDTRERNLLAKHMGECDWYVQIDSDEYFVDFPAFIRQLNWFDPKVPTTVACRVATLFKQVKDGYLVVAESLERLNFATNNPVYDVARNNDSGNVYEFWDDLVLHQSWARKPEEIYLKLHNWSHKDDFNVDSFYSLWNAIDANNAYALHNFHPLIASSWCKLRFVEGNIPQILKSEKIKRINESEEPPIKKKPLLSRIWKEIKSEIWPKKKG
jgi:hypothetical protein